VGIWSVGLFGAMRSSQLVHQQLAVQSEWGDDALPWLLALPYSPFFLFGAMRRTCSRLLCSAECTQLLWLRTLAELGQVLTRDLRWLSQSYCEGCRWLHLRDDGTVESGGLPGICACGRAGEAEFRLHTVTCHWSIVCVVVK